MTSRNVPLNGTAATRESSNSARGRAILRIWRLSNGWTQSTSSRKSQKKRRRRNAKSQRRNRRRQCLKLRSPREKSQRPKLQLRKKRNLLHHRPKNRSRKSGVGSDESQAIAKISCSDLPRVRRDPRDPVAGPPLACFGSIRLCRG